VQRDFSAFPRDENGDALWEMSEDGDDLTLRREMDFSVIFPSEDAAFEFATNLLRSGLKVSYSPNTGDKAFPWQVQVHPCMIPTHAAISEFEHRLAKESAPWGGRNDGWGCFSQD
jgi:hypothetical protein